MFVSGKFRKYLKRLFWAAIAAVFLYMMVNSSQKLLMNYLYHPFTFSIDTAYLHWNTTFPSVSLCQILNDESMADMLENEIGEDRDYKLDNVISDIAFYSGTCYSCEDCTNGHLDCPRNFSTVVERYRSDCATLISNCYWQNEPFDCCRLFLPLETEFGLCYSINSQNSLQKAAFRLINNRYTGPGELRFKVNEDIQIYLHDSYAVPYAYVDRALKETVLWGMNKEIIIKVIEMENTGNVQDIPINRRYCRFPWENPDEFFHLYSSYSFSSCAVECFMKTQLKYCNCTHHLMPRPKNGFKPVKICSFKGLTCLTENSAVIAKQRKQCNCLSSCVEPEFFVIYSSESEVDNEENQVTIRMLSLPDSRFVRNTARTELDLFISLGGIVGLFSGASVITLFYIASVAIRYVASARKQRAMEGNSENSENVSGLTTPTAQ
ncbi:pickpocket protein 19-like [Toxorhynchites rutilus septentrionalis]|uniref:pickpocket protein 19-like n=1 Tax=Toxorhynchites rutilus septentrionalis TaxID=329112 RepID=UPI00247A2DB6|nr:pickpocket protein 19-like [Toxorhynchites rutilus septentrionalis]